MAGISLNVRKCQAGGVAQIVEHLPSKYKALNSNPQQYQVRKTGREGGKEQRKEGRRKQGIRKGIRREGGKKEGRKEGPNYFAKCLYHSTFCTWRILMFWLQHVTDDT
jgi:hypothetical protein